MPKKLSHDEYAIKLAKENPDVELLTEYKGNKKPVTVRCRIDGYEWVTTPYRLHYGAGCQKCYDRRRGQSSKIPLSEQIGKAKETHKEEDGSTRYDYSLIDEEVYKNSHQKVPIICKRHGVFYQRFSGHIFGKRGCPICGIERIGDLKRMPQEEFIRRAHEAHQNEDGSPRYDYSMVEYKGNDTEVCIICPEHGEFWQAPYSHLAGHNCPKCNMSRLEGEMIKRLNGLGVEYVWQATRKELPWIGRQSLDFYLPTLNLAIECHGMQHFNPIGYYGGDDGLEIIRGRDKRKNELCEENGVRLIYVVPSTADVSKILLNEGSINDSIYNKDNLFRIDEWTLKE